jgi:hypothetical protein
MLTATIIFTVLVAAWGRTATIAARVSPRRHVRSGH